MDTKLLERISDRMNKLLIFSCISLVLWFVCMALGADGTCAQISAIGFLILSKLEDYKRLKSEKEQDIYERAYRDGQDKGLSDGHFAGYNKAIDDFVEKAIEEQIQYDCPLDRHDIEKIAEQLKAGEVDG